MRKQKTPLRLPTDYADTLRELPRIADNPFYWRERRRGARRGEPFRAMLIAVAVLGAGLLAAMASRALLDGAGSPTIPAPLLASLPFAVVAALHVRLVAGAAARLGRSILIDEVRRGTLAQVLVTPVGPFEILAQMVVYPAQHALLVAMAGLPVYALLWEIGLTNTREVLVLYLLLGLTAIAAPQWRTPALADCTPAELEGLATAQERSAGCNTAVLAILFIPGSLMVGGMLYGLHAGWPALLRALPIPNEVWYMLWALPVTHAAVAVKLLAAPFTWFGLPLPIWIWAIPLLLTKRLLAVWHSSFYLRVSDMWQIRSLPDYTAFRRWSGAATHIWQLAVIGYCWRPLLETGWTGSLVNPAGPATPADSLAGAFFVAFAIGFAMVLARFRRRRTEPAGAGDTAATWLWVFGPLAPAGLVLAIGLASQPMSVLSAPVVLMVWKTLLVGGALLVLASAFEQNMTGWWWLVVFGPAILPFFRALPASIAAAASPMVALMAPAPGSASLVQFLLFASTGGAATPGGGITYVLPPWWASAAVPLGVGLMLRFARSASAAPAPSRGRRRGPMVVRMQAAGNTAGQPAPPPDPTVTQPVAPPSASLDVTQPMSAPPPAAQPMAPAAVAESAPPPLPPQPPPAYVPPGYPAFSMEPLWRRKPLSPLAARSLRWLVSRTDNPLAVFGARRFLPGSLNSDLLVLCLGALIIGLLAGAVLPELLMALPFPIALPVAEVLYPVELARAPTGMALLVSHIAIAAVLSHLAVFRRVANAYLVEREQATLGLLLATPLSSRGIVVGKFIGPALPAAVFTAICLVAAVVPSVAMGFLGSPLLAASGWVIVAVTLSLSLFAQIATGTWVGLTRRRTKDVGWVAGGIPALIFAPGAALALELSYDLAVPVYASLACALALSGLLAWGLWALSLSRMAAIRRADLPLDGQYSPS